MTYGFRGFIGGAKEVAWGTPVAATFYFEALSESIVTTIDRFQTKNIVGGAMYEPDDEDGIRHYAGEIVAPAHPQTMGNFLKGAFGQNSVTVLLSGALFLNEFKPATIDAGSSYALPPYTLEVNRDITSSDQFTGAQFNTIMLATAPNQELRMTVGVIAKSVAQIAPTTPSFPNSPLGVFKFDTCLVQIAGVTAQRVEALSFSFDNQLEGIPVLNSTNVIARCQRNNFQMVRVTGTLSLDDFSDVNVFRSQSEFAIKATFSKANSFQLIMEAPRMVFETFPHQLTGRQRLTVDFSAIGRYLVTSANALRIALTTVNTF